jgi:hypothetical protein
MILLQYSKNLGYLSTDDKISTKVTWECPHFLLLAIAEYLLLAIAEYLLRCYRTVFWDGASHMRIERSGSEQETSIQNATLVRLIDYALHERQTAEINCREHEIRTSRIHDFRELRRSI